MYNFILKNSLTLVNNIIIKYPKVFIGRIGGIEFDAYCYYKTLMNQNKEIDMNSEYINNLFTYCGYYDTDKSLDVLHKFMSIYEKYYIKTDIIFFVTAPLLSYVGVMGKENSYYNSAYNNNIYVKNILNNDLLKIKNKVKMSYIDLESFEHFQEFYSALNNKKILIISPFEKEIREQLKIKDKLFTKNAQMYDFTNFKYPNFKKVEYLNTFLTTNNYETPHKNIIETFEYYKKLLKEKDFEIVLLISGAYSYLLGDYIYNELNKSVIHVGGIGQLFFGIKGGRYLTPYFESMMNEYWIFPYTNITENAPGVPEGDGLLGYFKKK